jgi:hypothetical protein
MSKSECQNLVIGAWDLICHLDLDIGHFFDIWAWTFDIKSAIIILSYKRKKTPCP